MTDILAFKLEATSLTTSEVSEWLTGEKQDNSYRPLSTDSRGLFSFGVHGAGDLVGWTGATSSDRAFAVTIENDDFMFFVEHGTCYDLATGGIHHAITPGTALLTTADRYSAVNIHAGSVAEGFCIPRSAVHAALISTFERLPPADFEFAPRQDMTAGPAAPLFKLMRFFRDEICADQNLEVSPLALTSFQEMFCLLMVQNLPHTLSDTRSPAQTIAPRQLRRASDFAREHIAMPITIADMAAAAGVSVRTLQVNFRRFFDMTPMAYLRQLRLAGAREEITAAATSLTVREIACRWGFTHQGRFAQEYRAAFGVSPKHDMECAAKRTR